jgi:hypothetical protein
VGVLCLAVMTAQGCRTASPPAAAPPPAEPVYVEVAAGRVVHVNGREGHVILECPSLPSAGEEAKVYRGAELVGRLRISHLGRFPFVAADIVEGEPREGDLARRKIRKGATAPNGERKE